MSTPMLKPSGLMVVVVVVVVVVGGGWVLSGLDINHRWSSWVQRARTGSDASAGDCVVYLWMSLWASRVPFCIWDSGEQDRRGTDMVMPKGEARGGRFQPLRPLMCRCCGTTPWDPPPSSTSRHASMTPLSVWSKGTTCCFERFPAPNPRAPAHLCIPSVPGDWASPKV